MKWLSRLFRKPLLDRADARVAAMELSDTAVSHLQKGQKELAGEYFKKSIKTDPTWSASHLNFARFLFTQRNYVECAHYLESAMRNARNGSDPKNDARVLADGELLEGALRLHGVGGGTVRQQFAALAAVRGRNADEFAPEPDHSSHTHCTFCQSKIERKAPVHMLLPHEELKGASPPQRDAWYKALGQICGQCGKWCCGYCYVKSGQKCPNCGGMMSYFTR